MSPELEGIVTRQDSAPVEGKRLTTTQYIQVLARLEAQLHACAEAYSKLPGASNPNEVRGLLKAIMQGAKFVEDSAERLISAND